ncbi:hypothetical protein FDUTEX481_05752 [Tolypothrix sp. PCC 7601]|nr:hypothetical protein FDUTEX481_05752 [Tolypothrix sp. PCC 7601]
MTSEIFSSIEKRANFSLQKNLLVPRIFRLLDNAIALGTLSTTFNTCRLRGKRGKGKGK